MIIDRAILLPAIGDPFLLNLWFTRSYPNFKDEVDCVYLVLDSSHINDDNGSAGLRENKKYLFDKYNSMPGVTAEFSKNIGLGATLTEIFDVCKHKYFGMIQEDAFVYKKGEVGRYFKMIEDNQVDVVGSPIYDYTAVLNEILAKITEGREPYLTNLGYAFWQNFFFASIETMRQTDMNLACQTWLKGVYIDYLKTAMPCDVSLEIMAAVSFQLRTLKKRFHYVSQFLSLLDDKFYPLDVCFWQHITTLSGIFGYMYVPEWLPEVTDSHRIDFERRVAWWQYALSAFPAEEIPKIQKFYDRYQWAINEIKTRYQLSDQNIGKRMAIINRLFNI